MIRVLQSTDVEAFHALRLRGLEEIPAAFSSSLAEERILAIETVAARLADQSLGVAFGAFHESALVGLLGVRREHHVKLAHRAFLWGMYVAPEARRLRLGQKLIEHALTYARETLRARQVVLGVASDNRPAIELYERMGFRAFAVEPDYLCIDGEYRDEIHMIRFFEPSRPRANRSMPESVVIPVLAYPDVRAAVEWLCRCFGFEERLRIADHRSQLTYRDGAVVVAHGAAGASSAGRDSIMMRVDDVDAHHRRALENEVRVLAPPTDHPYGERQYTAVDCAGHVWTFSETVADVDPATWGGERVRSR